MSRFITLNCGNKWGNVTKSQLQALAELQQTTGLPDEAIEHIKNWLCEQTNELLSGE